MRVTSAFSLPFMGRGREPLASPGGVRIVSAHPWHGPTRAALRSAVPPHEGEGETP